MWVEGKKCGHLNGIPSPNTKTNHLIIIKLCVKVPGTFVPFLVHLNVKMDVISLYRWMYAGGASSIRVKVCKEYAGKRIHND